MTVLEFIGQNFTYFEVENFKEKFSSTRSKKAIYQLLRSDINSIRQATINEMANHFTNGDVQVFLDLIKNNQNIKNG